MKHTVDTNLLIQDSHIHIMIYAIVAALQSLIIFGLGWPGWFRDSMIVAAFGFGALDFAGQWLMKAGLPGFAWLTIASGWGMALVYLIVLGGNVRAMPPPRYEGECHVLLDLGPLPLALRRGRAIPRRPSSWSSRPT